jgi:hypothetical protein
MNAEMKEILRALDLGNSVAEFDNSLEKYFIENEAFHAVVKDKVDIVAGDKGTGKTALFKILQKRYSSIRELDGVEVLAAFNPAGNPIFQRLVKENVLSEGQYVAVWKTYVLALTGNWLIEFLGEDYSANVAELSALLTKTGLRSKDDKPETVFARIINAIQSAFPKTKSAEIEFSISETGIPIVKPKVNFFSDKERQQQSSEEKEVSHETALRLLDKCLSDFGYKFWIVLDRLDEAFQGFPDVEIPALRALFRTYLDLLEFKNFRLKLFVRRDLFRRIIGDGFVNLTHINARKIEIIWDEGDLLNLLCRRVRDNQEVMKVLVPGGEKQTDDALFYKIFPAKVDAAERKPTTLNWIMSRIRDGNGIRPPRNLIDLTTMAKDEQLRMDGRVSRDFSLEVPLVTSDAIRRALGRLSTQRVEDTLLAEVGADAAALIQKFRGAKAEQNEESLAKLLGIGGENLRGSIKQLVDVGFLEEIKASWKVPMLYRDGLDITQGKAFQANPADTGEETDDEA